MNKKQSIPYGTIAGAVIAIIAIYVAWQIYKGLSGVLGLAGSIAGSAGDVLTTPGADLLFGKGTTNIIMQPGYKTIGDLLNNLHIPPVTFPSAESFGPSGFSQSLANYYSGKDSGLFSTPYAGASAVVGGLASLFYSAPRYAAPGTPATPLITTPQTASRLAPLVSVVAPAGKSAVIPSNALSFKLRSLK